MWFKIYYYDQTEDKYIYLKSLDVNDIEDLTYVERNFQDFSELNILLKAKHMDLVKYDKPLLFRRGEGDITYYISFIISREFQLKEGKPNVILKGCDFNYFKHHKIVNSNLSFTTTDPDNLPEKFACYYDIKNINDHLDYVYTTTFYQPRIYTYGTLSYTLDNNRKFKGLNSITVDLPSDSREIITEQCTVKEFEEQLSDKFNQKIVTQQTLNSDGKIDILVTYPKGKEPFNPLYDPSELNNNSFKILDEMNGVQTTINCVFGKGDPNNFTTKSNVSNKEFTTMEKVEDYSFISAGNNTYLQSATQNNLNLSLKERNLEMIKVTSDLLLKEVHAGDVASIDNNIFYIKQIEEKINPESGITHSIDIELIEE